MIVKGGKETIIQHYKENMSFDKETHYNYEERKLNC
jgi:hypothetical protein